MFYRKVITGIIMVSLLFFEGCAMFIQDKSPDNQPSQEKGKQHEEVLDPIQEQIKDMTLKEKVGQMIVVGLEGYIMDDNIRAMIEDYHVGGIIVLGGNVESANQLLTLVNSLKSSNLNNRVPLFISVDEEGGRISRMPGELEKLPANKAIGKVNNSNFSYKIGGILAEELKSFGLNTDFAPVLDINSNPQNPVIGDRSFGSDSTIVSNLGIQTMKGIRAGGVISVVKHFPGHGDTSVDSHVGLPSVSHDLNRLNSTELLPFKAAIDNGADAVMVAHILLTKIDSQNPSSLSKTIVTDLLRKQLHFNGVVFTDDMTMGAIIKNYNIADAAIKAVKAGNDIVLVCHGYDNEFAVIDALNKAVEDGVITEERVDESVYRILDLKEKYNLTDNITDSINVEKINNDIKRVLETFYNVGFNGLQTISSHEKGSSYRFIFGV